MALGTRWVHRESCLIRSRRVEEDDIYLGGVAMEQAEMTPNVCMAASVRGCMYLQLYTFPPWRRVVGSAGINACSNHGIYKKSAGMVIVLVVCFIENIPVRSTGPRTYSRTSKKLSEIEQVTKMLRDGGKIWA